MNLVSSLLHALRRCQAYVRTCQNPSDWAIAKVVVPACAAPLTNTPASKSCSRAWLETVSYVGRRPAPRASVGPVHAHAGPAGRGWHHLDTGIPGNVGAPTTTIPAGKVAQGNVCLRASCRNYTPSLTRQAAYESAEMLMFQPTTIIPFAYCITTDALTMESIIVLVSPSFLLPGLSLTNIDRRLVKISNQSMHKDAHSLPRNVL